MDKWGGYEQATDEAKRFAFSEIIHPSSLPTLRFMKFCPEVVDVTARTGKMFLEQLPEVSIAAHLDDATQKHRANQQCSELVVPQGCCVCRGHNALSSPGSCHQSWWDSHPQPLTQALANNHPPNV